MANKREQTGALGLPGTDIATVEAIVTRAGTSFARGMKVLPPDRRAAMFAIYAFCREVDDIADGDVIVDDQAAALESWKTRIRAIQAGARHDAIDRVLGAAIATYDLQIADFDAVIDGMAMDASGPIIAPDEETLDLYCDRVASAVGRLSVRAFGDSSDAAMRVAYHLGRALQLTNILRDIQEDASRNRLYLPKSLLERFHVPADPAEAPYAHGLDPLARVLAARALDQFRVAEAAMDACDRVAMRPARMMAASYRVVLNALLKRGWKHPEIALRGIKIRRVLASLRAWA